MWQLLFVVSCCSLFNICCGLKCAEYIDGHVYMMGSWQHQNHEVGDCTSQKWCALADLGQGSKFNYWGMAYDVHGRAGYCPGDDDEKLCDHISEMHKTEPIPPEMICGDVEKLDIPEYGEAQGHIHLCCCNKNLCNKGKLGKTTEL